MKNLLAEPQFQREVLMKVVSEPSSKLVGGLNGPRRKKTCLRGFSNNTGADQPAHPLSLINAFVIRFFEITIFDLESGKIRIF